MVIRLCLSPSGDHTHTHSCLSALIWLRLAFFKVIRCIKKQLCDKALKEYYAELHSRGKKRERREGLTRVDAAP